MVSASKPDGTVVLGKLGSTYGIRGWLRLFSSTENVESIFDYQPWYIQQAGKWQKIELESWKWHNTDLVIKLKNINDQALANTLVNSEIVVYASQLPKLEEGDYYWKDLLGCSVETITGDRLGIVSDMMTTGSNDVLVVKADLKSASGVKEWLIPFLEPQVIKRVDLDEQKIVVDWDPNF